MSAMPPDKPVVAPEKARELMELAVDVMLKSVAEVRSDGKVTPRVGAVLLKPDGSVVTAHRGELRDGDHAEFTLLERKHRDVALDGSVLFATLEPCAPGARKHPKLSCAERIVLARIKRVYVGIEDPDPTVAKGGLRLLRRHGVEFVMFDRDLQDKINDANEGFLKQAHERAELERDGTADPPPPPMDVGRSTLSQLSDRALEVYRDRAGIGAETGSDAFWERLASAGFVVKTNGKFQPTGHGMLLFGRRPRETFPQAGLLARIEYPDGSNEREEFGGPLILIPEAVEKWLSGKLPNVMTREAMRRSESHHLAFESVREAVVNALVHRDYEVEGAKVQLVIDSNTVKVMSPGGPVYPLTLPLLQGFNAPMISRNPKLHFAFQRMELAEEMGFGLRTLRDQAREKGLPLPQFAYRDPYLTLTLFRTPESAQAALAPDVQAQLSSSERDGWAWLAQRSTATRAEYQDAFGLAERTARNHLGHFADLGLVEVHGRGPSTRYVVRAPSDE